MEGPAGVVPEDLVLRPETSESIEEEEPFFAGFSYIANDSEPEEMEGLQDFSGESPAEEQQAEASMVETPSAALQDDYAADHELFCAGQDATHPKRWGTACPSAFGTHGEHDAQDETFPLPVLNSGLSQLLKLVQAELKAQEQKEQEAPIPDQTSAELSLIHIYPLLLEIQTFLNRKRMSPSFESNHSQFGDTLFPLCVHAL